MQHNNYYHGHITEYHKNTNTGLFINNCTRTIFDEAGNSFLKQLLQAFLMLQVFHYVVMCFKFIFNKQKAIFDVFLHHFNLNKAHLLLPWDYSSGTVQPASHPTSNPTSGTQEVHPA